MKLRIWPWSTIQKLRLELEAVRVTCTYTEVEPYFYLTHCGREFWLVGGKELYDYCHWCGGRIEEVKE